MLKRSFCLLMVFSFLFAAFFNVSVLTVNAEENPTDNIDDEETLICDATIGDAFEPGEVIVVLKKSATAINRVHTPESFGDVGVVSVEELSYITNEKARSKRSSLLLYPTTYRTAA